MNGEYKSFSSKTRHSNAMSGNAMVYVLIIVALFGALSFVLSRQTDSTEANIISGEQLAIYTSTMQQTAMQLKQSIEQMTWSGTNVDNLDFMKPDDTNFNDPVITNKLFHPQGGGAAIPRLSPDVINDVSNDPDPGWYIGRFNNVEWTPSSNDDVILTAHQITQELCASLNEALTGSSAIPELQVEQANELLIDETESTASGNIEFTSAHCANCFGQPSLCIKENGANFWSFYSILAAE